MTREQILALPAGKELDDLCCAAMGYTKVPATAGGQPWGHWWVDDRRVIHWPSQNANDSALLEDKLHEMHFDMTHYETIRGCVVVSASRGQNRANAEAIAVDGSYSRARILALARCFAAVTAGGGE